MFTYNINDRIKVKLTEHGKTILGHELADTMSMLNTLKFFEDYAPYHEDEDGYIKFQLWDFMRIFGSYFSLGSPLIIEHNEIIFIDEMN